ncbi:MAG: ABC transporter permease [Thermoprotei archaeon]
MPIDITSIFFSPVFYLNMLKFMTPITIAALGEIIAERSGIVNIGLEGLIILGALSSVFFGIFSGNVVIALLAGILTGIISGIIYAIIVIYLKGDQIVTGIGLNLFAYGFGVIVLYFTWGTFANSPYLPPSSMMPKLWGVSPLIPLTIFLSILTWYVFKYTSIGLRVKAVGENPEVAESAGINIYRIRTIATIIGATLATMGGIFMGIDWLNQYTRDIAGGRGFIALALVVFSNWNPLRLIAGGFIFGFLYALSLSIPSGIIPDQFLSALPYIATLLVVAGYAGKAKPPAALGKPYTRE